MTPRYHIDPFGAAPDCTPEDVAAVLMRSGIDLAREHDGPVPEPRCRPAIYAVRAA